MVAHFKFSSVEPSVQFVYFKIPLDTFLSKISQEATEQGEIGFAEGSH